MAGIFKSLSSLFKSVLKTSVKVINIINTNRTEKENYCTNVFTGFSNFDIALATHEREPKKVSCDRLTAVTADVFYFF